MKNFFNSLKNTFRSTLSKDPYHKTDLESLYFKKAVFKDLPPQASSNSKPSSNVIVEDKIKSLNRTILTGMQKKLMESRISQLVYENRFHPLKPEIRELCEIVDYACRNNIPVRVNYLKLLLPNIEIDDSNVLDEKSYEQWLKNKGVDEEIDREPSFHIEDAFGMREEKKSKRGKQGFEDWKTNGNKSDRWQKM